jgi:hypothetical protein
VSSCEVLKFPAALVSLAPAAFSDVEYESSGGFAPGTYAHPHELVGSSLKSRTTKPGIAAQAARYPRLRKRLLWRRR